MAPAGDRHQGFGFFTVVHSEDGGISGGFLVLNASGRPLEFHCTAVVKPSRAQQILYGPTLLPYLVGEQIGPTLLRKAKSSIEMVFTDTESSYSMRQTVDTPLIYVATDPVSTNPANSDSSLDGTRHAEEIAPPAPADARRWRVDAAHERPRAPHWTHFVHNELSLANNVEYADDQRRFIELADDHLRYLDFSEPFTRVREAVAETLNTGRV